MEIKTERLTISEFHQEMAEQVHLLSLDDNNRRFMSDEVFETKADALETLEFLISCYDGTQGPFVYPVLLEGQNIGHVELVAIDDGWEIGYHIGAAYTGRGYASEAVQAFLPFIMQKMNLDTVYGICVSENIASRHVMENCGFCFSFEGEGLYRGEKRMICRYKFQK